MVYVGVDLGATNTAVALVDERSAIMCKASTPTPAAPSAEQVVSIIMSLISELLKEAGLNKKDIIAVGVGIPGLAYPKTGLVHSCPNLFWHQVPLQDMLQERLDVPFHITNDANCAALAELESGVFIGKQNAVLMTLGSGVGGGIILNGKLYTGSHGAAGEIGHMVVRLSGEACTCGNLGCFERYASAGALVRISQENSLAPALTARDIIAAAMAGDTGASKVFAEYVYNLAEGVVSIINIFDPEIIALGGGVSETGAFLLDAVRTEVSAHLLFKDYPNAEIVLAALNNDAGLIGAASFARHENDNYQDFREYNPE